MMWRDQSGSGYHLRAPGIWRRRLIIAVAGLSALPRIPLRDWPRAIVEIVRFAWVALPVWRSDLGGLV